MKRTPEQEAARRNRSWREHSFPKCQCGNVAGLGQTYCRACRKAKDRSFLHAGVSVQIEAIEMTQHTKDFLAQELRAAGLNDMADKAAIGHYHDFLSPLVAPELQLLADLQGEMKRRSDAGGGDTVAVSMLIGRHMHGEFDASKEESDEWAASQDGQEAFGEPVRSVSGK
jgi:hypothetical protein